MPKHEGLPSTHFPTIVEAYERVLEGHQKAGCALPQKKAPRASLGCSAKLASCYVVANLGCNPLLRG